MPRRPRPAADRSRAQPGADAGDHRQRLRRAGERLALEHFERLGFVALARNFHTRAGELDLVVFDGHTIVFVEVKTRRAGCGAPSEAIGPTRGAQVRRMASYWLALVRDRPQAAELRFDAVGVLVDARGRLLSLDHLENAF